MAFLRGIKRGKLRDHVKDEDDREELRAEKSFCELKFPNFLASIYTLYWYVSVFIKRTDILSYVNVDISYYLLTILLLYDWINSM